MIIDKDILIEKFAESEDKGYDYLIDNAETDEQITSLLVLQNFVNSIPKHINPKSSVGCEGYMRHKKDFLESIGVDISLLEKDIAKFK